MDPQHTAKQAYTTPQSTTLGLQPVIRVPWSLLIYRPPRDGWLSWPCWLTDSGRLNHVQLSSLAQDRESSPADTSVITTILCRQIWSTRPTPSPLEQGSRLDDVTILLLRLLLIAEIWWQSASSWRWRCFLAKVADLDTLLNRTRRHRTHERQHQTQITARASRRNEDRAAILLYNNPLPQLCYDIADYNIPPSPSRTMVSFFYRASSMPMHAKRGIVMANPSVCLYVTLWYCIATNTHIVRHSTIW